jgi:hypothetical protein
MKPINIAIKISVISMVRVVRVGQHAGKEFVNSGEPLDNFESVGLVDGEAHINLPV